MKVVICAERRRDMVRVEHVRYRAILNGHVATAVELRLNIETEQSTCSSKVIACSFACVLHIAFVDRACRRIPNSMRSPPRDPMLRNLFGEGRHDQAMIGMPP